MTAVPRIGARAPQRIEKSTDELYDEIDTLSSRALVKLVHRLKAERDGTVNVVHGMRRVLAALTKVHGVDVVTDEEGVFVGGELPLPPIASLKLPNVLRVEVLDGQDGSGLVRVARVTENPV